MSGTWSPGPGATGGNDSYTGTNAANTADGLGGNDTLSGLDGNDTLRGGDGNDSISGGNDDNRLFGDAGNDTVLGGADNDTIIGGTGADSLVGGSGNDIIYTGNSVAGGMFDDSIRDVVTGNQNSDTIYAGWNDAINMDGGVGTGGNNNLILVPTGYTTITGSATVDGVTYNANFADTAGHTIYATNWDSWSTYTPLPCFASGTRIATARGEVAVEELRVGDLVVCAGGGAALQPVIWLGHSEVNVARHPEPHRVQPILIRAGALGRGVPFRDLRVSPDHAMLLDGHLVPAGLLVNGATILREAWCPRVTYWHVELPGHAVLMAEGAPAESYLDDGNRRHFDNGAIAMLFKDFASERANGIYDREACYPVLRDGERLEAIRARLAQPQEAKAPRAARRA